MRRSRKVFLRQRRQRPAQLVVGGGGTHDLPEGRVELCRTLSPVFILAFYLACLPAGRRFCAHPTLPTNWMNSRHSVCLYIIFLVAAQLPLQLCMNVLYNTFSNLSRPFVRVILVACFICVISTNVERSFNILFQRFLQPFNNVHGVEMTRRHFATMFWQIEGGGEPTNYQNTGAKINLL